MRIKWNEGPKCKKGENEAKLDKAKHGFKRNSFFAFVRANRLREKKREEKRRREEKKIIEEEEEEKKRRINQGMDM